ncbi:MAG: FAD-dependent oxidoreductase [Desulfobacteraceae bacterium]|jgi:pyruvate/2-oxoglutarate dehydrogenase complex dihydrolipoamide dehydrogenase (E3) component
MMANYDFDMGVIGAGAAGLTVTAGAAQLGAKTLLIEKENLLGGDCLHYGCVPSKTLIRTAQVYHQMKKAEEFGLPPVNLQPVDFRQVAKRIQSVIQTIQKHDSEERFCGLGAQVEYGQPTFVDEHSIRLNGKTYSAKNWVISTGSSPSIPPIEGLDKTPFITNKETFSLDHLPKSMIILGAGPIATEMAQAFSRLGTQIDVIQRSNQILSKEDRDMAGEVMESLKSEGVAIHLNTTVVSAKDLRDEREVIIKDLEDKETKLRAETILVAMGREANLAGLGLENAGVEFSGKGLQVDKRLRTTQKHIYAAGDVTGTYLFTHAAGYEGGIVISNAIFHLPRKVDYAYLPWCTYTDPELASIGMNEKAAKAAGIEYSVWTEAFKDNDRSLAEGEKMGKIKMILDAKEKPLGVQILGPHAGELLSEWVAVLNGKVKLSILAAAVHPYPTLGEINKRVAGTYFSPKIFSDKVKKGLKFFFHLKGRACEQES